MSGTTKIGIVQDGLRLYFDAGNPRSRIEGALRHDSTNVAKNIAKYNNNFTSRYLEFDVGKQSPTFLNQNGGIYDFDGLNDGLNLIEPYTIVDVLSTISFWLKIDTVPSASPYQLLYSDADDFGIQITLDLGNLVIRKYDGLNERQADTRTQLNTGQWYNYVWVGIFGFATLRDRIYLNGILDIEYVSSTETSKISDILYIGTSGATNFFDGKISNFMVYDRQLSDAEVLQNYNALKYRFI